MAVEQLRYLSAHSVHVLKIMPLLVLEQKPRSFCPSFLWVNHVTAHDAIHQEVPKFCSNSLFKNEIASVRDMRGEFGGQSKYEVYNAKCTWMLI